VAVEVATPAELWPLRATIGDWDQEQREWEKLRARSLALPEGEIVGGLLRWQRGDGYAFYIVVNDDPLEIAHVPFGDEWRVEPPLIRGLNRDDVEDMLAREKAMADLFGRGRDLEA
jgi:hypothetical protein